MDDELERLRHRMEETRSSLAEKLEALENQLQKTVESAATTVEKTAETVQETVQHVKETFNLAHQVDRHPWLFMGSAVALGCLGGFLLAPSRERSRPSPEPLPAPPEPSRPVSSTSPRPTGNGFSHPDGPGEAKEPAETLPRFQKQNGDLQAGLQLLQGLAVGALMGLLCESVAQVLPEPLVADTSAVMDEWTVRLGGKPLPRLHREAGNFPST